MISFVVAMDKNRVIGKNNDLPWHLPEDLKFFKRVTMGHPIIMGRKTHESIGRALPGRENIIVTRDRKYVSEGCTVLHSINEVKDRARDTDEEIFVIGGSEIFKELFPIADRLYITYIDEEFEGDTFFPIFSENDWELISNERGIKDKENPYTYSFRVYDKKR